MPMSGEVEAMSAEIRDSTHINEGSLSLEETYTTIALPLRRQSSAYIQAELPLGGLDAPVSSESSQIVVSVPDTNPKLSLVGSFNGEASIMSAPTTPRDSQVPGGSPLPLKESLGLTGAASIVVGYVGILAILGFITFLWYGHGPSPEAAGATYVWRQIALGGWMTQAITLCALVLRLTISLQSIVCTSMIAALVLEKRFIQRPDVAYLSVLRSVNDGPRKLLEVMLNSGVSVFKTVELWLVVFMLATTLALQFTSTILLSDLNEFVIIGNRNRTQIPSLLSYRPDDFGLHLRGDSISTENNLFRIFAEVPSESNAVPNSYGLSQTGLIQRGFLPLADEKSRLSLRRLDGNIMIMNSKVACMRPTLDAHYTTVGGALETDMDTFRSIEGLLRYGSSLRDARASDIPTCNSPECEELYFECVMPHSRGSWESISCLVGGVGGSLWGINLPPKWVSTAEPWSLNSTIQLIFTTNMQQQDWKMLPSEGSLGTSKSYHEWQSFEPVPGRYINVTLCFSAFNIVRKSVRVASQHMLKQPLAKWAISSNIYDTSSIERFMDADALDWTMEERGIPSMDIIGESDDGPPGNPADRTVAVNAPPLEGNYTIAELTTKALEELIDFDLTAMKVSNSTIILCYICVAYGQIIKHPLIGMLFSSIISKTGRAANSLQSLMTITGSYTFDGYLSSLEELQWADIEITKTVLTPGPCSEHGCGGYISVIILLVIHLVYVAVITTLYLRQVRYSHYDNIWHTISQLVAPDLQVLLEKANNAGDKAVKSYCKELNDDRVQLGKAPETGRIEVIRFPKVQAALK